MAFRRSLLIIASATLVCSSGGLFCAPIHLSRKEIHLFSLKTNQARDTPVEQAIYDIEIDPID